MQQRSEGRVRRTEAEWREVLSRFEQSGLGVDAFCGREKIAPSSFHRWQRKLAGGIGTDAFVAVTSAPTPRPSAWRLVVSLPNGTELRLEG